MKVRGVEGVVQEYVWMDRCMHARLATFQHRRAFHIQLQPSNTSIVSAALLPDDTALRGDREKRYSVCMRQSSSSCTSRHTTPTHPLCAALHSSSHARCCCSSALDPAATFRTRYPANPRPPASAYAMQVPMQNFSKEYGDMSHVSARSCRVLRHLVNGMFSRHASWHKTSLIMSSNFNSDRSYSSAVPLMLVALPLPRNSTAASSVSRVPH